jgi:hypothetical protein
MPQPALHLLLGRQQLARWAAAHDAPFDTADPTAANAFLHGTLAPDMGNFPGGSSELAHAVHTVRTADVTRALFRAATTQAQTAFAWGWLSHVLADAEIHPLINAAALQRTANGQLTLIEHVRVEVGIDVRFCCDTPLLDGVRLRPAFFAKTYGFLADVIADVLRQRVTPRQLSRMERGLIVFSHAALDFARGGARRLCWAETGPRPSLPAALVWHAATRISPAESVVHAYLNPHAPDEELTRSVEDAIRRVHAAFHRYERTGLHDLPQYDLEDGTLAQEARDVA